jgi:hypothetical protein
MKTSYFAKYKGKDAVSIALSTPSWYPQCRRYPVLMPTWEMLNKYKRDGDKEAYTLAYMEILSKLDPKKVYEDLGEDAVLLCWEKSSDFCHRHIVASWLEAKLGIKIYEYGEESNESQREC